MAAVPPLYLRIQEMLRRQIASGKLGVGARLPSESELASRFETTRTTVRQALAHLTFEGLIVRRVGQGTYVAKPGFEGRLLTERPGAFEEQMERAGADVGFRLLGFDVEPAAEAVAASLHLAPETPIFRLRRLRLIDGEVVGFEDRSILEQIGARIPASALATHSVIAITEAAIGTPLGGVSVTVAAEPARAKVAQLLGVRSGSPILGRAHTFFDQTARPILTGTSLYRGDKYRFTYLFGRTEA
jgi:GntR family transcriptional regulator